MDIKKKEEISETEGKINNSKRYALFIGRWQPFHSGHKYLVDQALSQGKAVCIACRDTPISEKDPYSFEQRKEMIRRVFGNKVEIIKIPDIESINIGRNVGYAVNQIDPPEEITKISGTNIRLGKEDNIPMEVKEYLKEIKNKPIILSCGFSGAGKTFNSSYLVQGLKDYVIVGPGMIRKELGIKNWSRKDTPLAISKVIEKIEELNKIGKGAIVDANMRSSDLRQFYYDLAKFLGIEVITIEFYCEEQECKRRMSNRTYLKIEDPNDTKFYDQQKTIWQSPELDIRDILENEHVSVLRYDTLNQRPTIIKATEKSKELIQRIINILLNKEEQN